jgi:hypothetical protein
MTVRSTASQGGPKAWETDMAILTGDAGGKKGDWLKHALQNAEEARNAFEAIKYALPVPHQGDKRK